MSKIFLKIHLEFYSNITTYNQTTIFFFFGESIKLINMFSYSITIYFISSTKDYDLCYNPYSLY